MKNLIKICIFILLSSNLFSQSAKLIELQACLDAAVKTHPLSAKKELLNNSLSTQKALTKKSTLPSISWNGQAKIQSESIGLSFDNPNIPSIEIPLYSAQSTLDLQYTVYNGGLAGKQNALNSSITAAQINQLEIEIDKIKQELVESYLSVLFSDEKDKILKNSLDRIRINLARVQSALKMGVANKEDLLQMKIREKEIENEIFANQQDKLAQIKVLEQITGISMDENIQLILPQIQKFNIDGDIIRKEMSGFELEKEILDGQVKMIELQQKPKVFAFATAGTGYPNPLNFFDDNIGLFAMGGIGFSWQFYDWGKTKAEKKLLQIKQDMIQIHKLNLEKTLNRYNDNFTVSINKLSEMIIKENELIEMREEVASIQKIQVEKGVLLSSEYLNTLNEITASKIKLSSYDLQMIRLKLQYQLIKGKI